jgi:hypothetical protein
MTSMNMPKKFPAKKSMKSSLSSPKPLLLPELLMLIFKLLLLLKLKRLHNSNNRMANQLMPQLLLLQSQKHLDKSMQLQQHQLKHLSQQLLLSNQQPQLSPNNR